VAKKEADAILTALVNTIVSEVSGDNKVALIGFGSFERRERQALGRT
jgi:DNA-binding protein HU-beta